MERDYRRAAAIVVVAGLLALAADLIEINGRSVVDPATVLTIALVAVTAYYALQNRYMAQSMRVQADQFRLADLARQRETQILDIQPFLADKPRLTISRPKRTLVARWELPAPARPVLHLTATLRAMRAEPDPGSPDQRSSVSRGLGSRAPGTHPFAIYDLEPFLQPGTHTPYEDA